MKLRLFIFLFLAAFFIEVASIIMVGRQIGVIWTLLLLSFGMVTGALLIAKSGRDMLGKMQQKLAEGQDPNQHMVKGFIMLIVGILFLIPGFTTDILAFILLIPFIQTKVWGYMKRYFHTSGQFYRTYSANSNGTYSTDNNNHVIIDLESGDYHQENLQNEHNKPINYKKNDEYSK